MISSGLSLSAVIHRDGVISHFVTAYLRCARLDPVLFLLCRSNDRCVELAADEGRHSGDGERNQAAAGDQMSPWVCMSHSAVPSIAGLIRGPRREPPFAECLFRCVRWQPDLCLGGRSHVELEKPKSSEAWPAN